MSDKLTLEITEQEADILAMGTAMFLTFTQQRIERHENHKDYSMDKLFAKMDMLITTGDLWARLQKLQGVSQEDIAAYLAEQEN